MDTNVFLFWWSTRCEFHGFSVLWTLLQKFIWFCVWVFPYLCFILALYHETLFLYKEVKGNQLIRKSTWHDYILNCFHCFHVLKKNIVGEHKEFFFFFLMPNISFWLQVNIKTVLPPFWTQVKSFAHCVFIHFKFILPFFSVLKNKLLGYATI